MSEFTSYAIIGAGLVGNAFIQALLAAKPSASVVILTRSASKSSSLPSELKGNPTIKTAVVDYASTSSVSNALKEHAVEVVVDTVHVYEAPFHIKLVDAAKEAGTVKLFVPSEFGFVTEGADVSPNAQRVAVQKHLKEVGLPYVVIQAGLFVEYLPIIGGTLLGKFYIVGSGDVPFSTTSVTDVAGFLAHLLTHYPASKLAYTSYRLEGSRTTLKEVAKKLRVPIEFVQSVPTPDQPPQDAGDQTLSGTIGGHNFMTLVQFFIESGRASIGWDTSKDADDESLAGSGNKFWEGHQWKSVEKALGME